MLNKSAMLLVELSDSLRINKVIIKALLTLKHLDFTTLSSGFYVAITLAQVSPLVNLL